MKRAVKRHLNRDILPREKLNGRTPIAEGEPNFGARVELEILTEADPCAHLRLQQRVACAESRIVDAIAQVVVGRLTQQGLNQVNRRGGQVASERHEAVATRGSQFHHVRVGRITAFCPNQGTIHIQHQ